MKYIAAMCFEVVKSFGWSVIRLLVPSRQDNRSWAENSNACYKNPWLRWEASGWPQPSYTCSPRTEGASGKPGFSSGTTRSALLPHQRSSTPVPEGPNSTQIFFFSCQQSNTEIHTHCHGAYFCVCLRERVMEGGAYHFLMAVTPHVDPVDLQRTTLQLAASCHFMFDW